MSLRTPLLLIPLLLLTHIYPINSSPGLQDHEPEITHIMEEEALLPEGRSLASTNTTGWPFRINAYYGAISNSAYQSYFQNKLIPPILDYFSHALTLKWKLTNGITLFGSTFCSGYTTPAELKSGLSTDFYWLLATQTANANWVADSGHCNLAASSRRPFIGKTVINTAMLSIPDPTDVLTHEKNMICLMHEFIHNMGMAIPMLNYYLDTNGNRLAGHLTKQKLDGVSTTVVNTEPLTSMLRDHFSCPTLIGAYLENGDTVGAHFERRHFGFEIMTSGLMYELQVSKFSLAFLQGTGWYYPDYTMADNYAWGEGQGCDFLFKSCTASDFDFADFCTGSNLGCSVPGVSGGNCYTDPLADGCKFYRPSRSYDCEDPSAFSSARLPNVEVFGRSTSSKCFAGTLSTATSSASQMTFCFNYQCSGSGSQTQLTVVAGSQSVVCSQAGTVSVSGYLGYINCPDPLTFCSTVGAPVCSRGCMGRGSCVDGQCVCNAGYSGKDCAPSV